MAKNKNKSDAPPQAPVKDGKQSVADIIKTADSGYADKMKEETKKNQMKPTDHTPVKVKVEKPETQDDVAADNAAVFVCHSCLGFGVGIGKPGTEKKNEGVRPYFAQFKGGRYVTDNPDEIAGMLDYIKNNNSVGVELIHKGKNVQI